jgi:dTDP-glucose 4,6-dehydratase
MDNLELAQLLSTLVHEVVPDAPALSYELVDFHSSRPGHDLRYALDGSYLKAAGFEYPVEFEESLRKMVRWTLAHEDWR